MKVYGFICLMLFVYCKFFTSRHTVPAPEKHVTLVVLNSGIAANVIDDKTVPYKSSLAENRIVTYKSISVK